MLIQHNKKDGVEMDLVNLMYRYINRFINSDELLNELENIDISQYSKSEIKSINKLILDVKNIKETIPNEIDDVERNRIDKIDHILKLLDSPYKNDKMEKKTKEFLDKQYNSLLKDKEKIRDGGKLYTSLFGLLTNHSLVNKYASKMDDKELLEFITKYISAPLPPQLTQDQFNDLVQVGIKEDKRESLWRLAFNYNRKNINFSLIEDYFIEMKDGYYLVELISAVKEDLNMDKLIKKIISTKDKEFINDVISRSKHIGLCTDDEIKEIKKLYE